MVNENEILQDQQCMSYEVAEEQHWKLVIVLIIKHEYSLDWYYGYIQWSGIPLQCEFAVVLENIL